ncbi:acyl carrier protein [Plantactinospora sp. S1510]|uniref:Acyl carrier protein n=1 Tax=Plantactinospora alkalitolerans TaxID=2789879 RepID=A0ABS0GNG5_9ACTN|nr:phosphopantetheine-binding protein [Plantactinospora alkalitolerans]MBF9127452.1 acyl carrier protein [Plantactinospora alkalitolerans]
MDIRQVSGDDITRQILEFLSAATGGTALAEDQDYIAEGLVNSIQAVELVTRVEQRFGIEVEVSDLDLDNFRTAGRIADFVRRKRAAAAPDTRDG